MSIKEKWKAWNEHAKQFRSYGAHSLSKGIYKYVPDGSFKPVSKPVLGAEAIFEKGSDTKRPTLTRIGAGALIAGPVGAVVGGVLRKNTSKNYVTVVFADGDTAIIEGPVKDEKAMREFALEINKQGSTT